jgi:hypothetical protein
VKCGHGAPPCSLDGLWLPEQADIYQPGQRSGLIDSTDAPSRVTYASNAMGMSYKIDQARQLVITRGWGQLSSDELLETMSQILLDPRFDPSYRSLGDLREVTSITVDTMATAQTAASPLFADGTRRAIVATSDVAYGMARMFAAYSERAGHEVRIFREMALAEAWLEV